MKETLGKILRIFTTALMVLSQSVETVRLFRRYKGEQMAELQAEKDKIAEERRPPSGSPTGAEGTTGVSESDNTGDTGPDAGTPAAESEPAPDPAT